MALVQVRVGSRKASYTVDLQLCPACLAEEQETRRRLGLPPVVEQTVMPPEA